MADTYRVERNVRVIAAPRRTAGVAVRRLAPFFGLAALIVAVDQLTKVVVRARLDVGGRWPDGAELLRIAHVENSGAAFGILQGAGGFLLVTTLIGVAAILAYLWTAPAGDRWHGAALGLILGGAVGNLIDRVGRGSVTDFIDPAHYPAFNIADSSIVVGVVALIVLSLFFAPPDGTTQGPVEGAEHRLQQDHGRAAR